MTTILIVLFLAVILFFLEIILPGGVLGVLGGILMLAGVYLTFDEFGAVAALLVLVGCLVFALAFFVFQFKILPKTAMGKNIFLSGSVPGESNVNEGGDTLVGAEGIVLTRMTPSGAVRVNGHRYEARSRSGFLETGTTVRVVERDAFRLLVEKKED